MQINFVNSFSKISKKPFTADQALEVRFHITFFSLQKSLIAQITLYQNLLNNKKIY